MTTPSREDPRRIYRGATAVRFAISEAFKTAYPAMRNRFLNGWEAAATDLPAIANFTPFDQIEWKQNSGPTLGVEVVNTAQFKKTDHNAYGSEEYRPTYSVRVTIWINSPNDDSGAPISPARELTIRQRDDQLAILRGILLASPSLGTETMAVNLGTLAEAYPIATPMDNVSKRWLVPGQLTFDVQADEWLTFTALGHVVETGIETEVLLRPEAAKYPNIDLLP